MSQPPIIDISGLIQADAEALRRVADALRGPCAEWGAFQIVGHGVPHAQLERFEAAMRRFFALPAEQKAQLRRTRDNARGYYDEELTKNRPDWKEVFDYGGERSREDAAGRHSDGVNQWPASLPELRAELLAHFRSCERVGLALLRALAQSLGVAPDRFDAAFEGHSSFVRLNHYAACAEAAPVDAPFFPESGRLGVHHHTDAGALTLVYQDAVPSLQVWYRGAFRVIEPVRHAFIVNLADMLQVWSNDRYRSPLHRVIVHADRERFSAPFFLNPAYEAICTPFAELLSEAAPARYRPVSWAHFRDQRSAGDYADYGHEIQIEDFRVEGSDALPPSIKGPGLA